MNWAQPSGRRRLASLVLAVSLLASFPRISAGQLAPAREYEIKAGFLFNFAKFVTWPEQAFKSDTDELRVEVIGHDPFDGALDRLVAGKTISLHPVVIVYSRDVSAQPRGHIVFISDSERKQLPALLAGIQGTPALTVSDIDHFAEHGGVIGLVAAGKSIKFVINRAAASRAGLHVGAGLLSLATILDRDSMTSAPRRSRDLAAASREDRPGGDGFHTAFDQPAWAFANPLSR